MVGTPPAACFAHPTKQCRRVGKGALAPCPPPLSERADGRVGTPPAACAAACFAHPTKRCRRVGKGALAPCPPSRFPDAAIEWWAHRRTHSRPLALPTLRNSAVGWAKAPLRRAHHHCPNALTEWW